MCTETLFENSNVFVYLTNARGYSTSTPSGVNHEPVFRQRNLLHIAGSEMNTDIITIEFPEENRFDFERSFILNLKKQIWN
jgi:hypothetical protein